MNNQEQSYGDLLKSVRETDKDRRRQSMANRDNQSLAMIANSELSDYRDFTAAKQVLRERGVQGVPE